MLNRISNRLSKVSTGLSTRGAIIVAFLAIVAASGVAFLLTRAGGSGAQADTTVQPIAARIDQVDGSIGIARTNADADSANNGQPDWAEATVNTPVSIGDRIYARNGSHASIALTGHDFVRLNPEASLDVLALADRRTQLALRSGSAIFDVGQLASDELYEVATPCGSVDFAQPGLYQVGLDGDNAVISVLNGVARVVGVGGSGDINRGQVFSLACSTPSEAAAATSPIAPNLAGEIVDDYYRDRYAKVYDGRYRNYDTYVADPYFYDPYRTSLSCQYVTADIPGLYDLDYYGDWVNVSDYGYCWAPRVSAGWAPFHSGFWDLDDLWGPTWVASESWGWAPYHYGRWAYVSDRWFWVPEVRTRSAYCPAPVAFFSVGEQIAWVPLGPREVYVPRYYDRNFSPRYLASADVINAVTRQRTFVNFNAPGAVTVVGVNALRGTIGPGRFSTGDPNYVARSRPVLDPLSVAGVRQIAASRGDARQRIKLARAEQDVFNRPVVASAKVAPAPGRQDLAKAFNVQSAPEKWKESKLKINQSGEATTTRRADGLPQSALSSPALSSKERERQMSALATRAEQGDKSARREMRQMMREEQRIVKQPAQQPPVSGQQAQTEQSRQQIKQQRPAERQQQVTTAAQQGAARQAQQQPMKPQQEIKQQRKVERQQQQAATASQQQAGRQAQQQQMKQQRNVERQQQMRQQQPQARPQQQQAPQQPRPPKQKPPDVQLQQQRQVVMQQQAARAQQAQRQAVRPQPRQGPELLGPPIRQNQAQRNVEQPRRKPQQ